MTASPPRKYPFPTLIYFTIASLHAEAARLQALGLPQVEYSSKKDPGLKADIYGYSGKIGVRVAPNGYGCFGKIVKGPAYRLLAESPDNRCSLGRVVATVLRSRGSRLGWLNLRTRGHRPAFLSIDECRSPILR